MSSLTHFNLCFYLCNRFFSNMEEFISSSHLSKFLYPWLALFHYPGRTFMNIYAPSQRHLCLPLRAAISITACSIRWRCFWLPTVNNKIGKYFITVEISQMPPNGTEPSDSNRERWLSVSTWWFWGNSPQPWNLLFENSHPDLLAFCV